jgi:hypothetical protein
MTRCAIGEMHDPVSSSAWFIFLVTLAAIFSSNGPDRWPLHLLLLANCLLQPAHHPLATWRLRCRPRRLAAPPRRHPPSDPAAPRPELLYVWLGYHLGQPRTLTQGTVGINPSTGDAAAPPSPALPPRSATGSSIVAVSFSTSDCHPRPESKIPTWMSSNRGGHTAVAMPVFAP